MATVPHERERDHRTHVRAHTQFVATSSVAHGPQRAHGSQWWARRRRLMLQRGSMCGVWRVMVSHTAGACSSAAGMGRPCINVGRGGSGGGREGCMGS